MLGLSQHTCTIVSVSLQYMDNQLVLTFYSKGLKSPWKPCDSLMQVVINSSNAQVLVKGR